MPIAAIKIVIERMQKQGNDIILHDKDNKESTGQPFWVPVPKSVGQKLEVGNTVTVVCVPMKNLSCATETLALVLHTSDMSSRDLFDRDKYLVFAR